MRAAGPGDEFGLPNQGRIKLGTFLRRGITGQIPCPVTPMAATSTASVMNGLSVLRGLRTSPSNGMFSCQVQVASRSAGCHEMAVMSMSIHSGGGYASVRDIAFYEVVDVSVPESRTLVLSCEFVGGFKAG